MSIKRGIQIQPKIVMTTILVGGLFIFPSCSNHTQKNQGNAGKTTSIHANDSILPPPPPVPASTGANPYQQDTPDKNGVYKHAQQMPQFPGGTVALMKYLIQHTKYPPKAKENNVYGTVVVQFVVNKNGSISDIKIVSKKLGDGLEQEAMRVAKNMPKWIPGKQNGKPVKVQSFLPIRFMSQ